MQKDKKEQIRQYCQRFKITGISSNLEDTVADAEQKSLGFMDFMAAEDDPSVLIGKVTIDASAK